MRVHLADDYSVEIWHHGLGYGDREKIVKVQAPYQKTFGTRSEEIHQSMVNITENPKIPGGRVRVLRRHWNPKPKVHKYGVTFLPNHYQRAYTYVDQYQKIDLRGRYLYVYDGISYTMIMTKKDLDTTKPIWWDYAPHVHMSSYTQKYVYLVNGYTNLYVDYVTSPLKKYPYVKSRDGDRIVHKHVPFVEGVYDVSLPEDEVFYLDTATSIKKLPKNAEVHEVFETPFKWRFDNTHIEFEDGELVLTAKHGDMTVEATYAPNRSENYLIFKIGRKYSFVDSEAEMVINSIKNWDYLNMVLQLL